MSDCTIGRKTHCRSEFKCLEKRSWYPQCTVDHTFGDSFMFVKGLHDPTCPHRMRFGGGYICDCPTHFALATGLRPEAQGPHEAGKVESSPQQHEDDHKTWPPTVEAAVAMLIEALPMKVKAGIANMPADEIGEATMDIGDHIRTAFGLEAGNEVLLQSCAKTAGCEIDHPDDASAVILARLVRELVETHRLSAV